MTVVNDVAPLAVLLLVCVVVCGLRLILKRYDNKLYEKKVYRVAFKMNDHEPVIDVVPEVPQLLEIPEVEEFEV
tara:strand:- start:992 stop:1213 length:222 start_codon:yes stop_codon:yes gene_type:complete